MDQAVGLFKIRLFKWIKRLGIIDYWLLLAASFFRLSAAALAASASASCLSPALV
jgi:hypothetical protein